MTANTRCSFTLRWSPFSERAVKLGSPDKKEGPDWGQAKTVYGYFRAFLRTGGPCWRSRLLGGECGEA